ncbi:MAG TPA: hypothetical protein VHF27_07485 [Acidimicrobiales bacterium]|nr:hypothetical protein [Acidimicrobiales bacterium]
MTVAGLLLLTACSGGGDATTLGPVPSAPSTTVAETTTTAAPASTTTTVARPTTTTRPSPATTLRRVVVDGRPQVTATPAAAAVGGQVRIEGTGFTDDTWKARQASLWLSGPGPEGCNFFAEAEHSVAVSAAGTLAGEFVVPYLGACRMSDSGGAVPVRAGVYRIVFACTACFVGEIEVTVGAVECANVGFTPNSDDVAGGIVAVGMTCAEAEGLVRTVGAQVGAGGPARVEANGFACVRTGQDDGGRGLPSSTFECTSGSKRVTFVRT